jgi:hypothetical protein
VADRRVLLEGLDGIVAHAGEVVVRGVVLAHVVDAEAPVLALLAPPLRRAKRARAAAAIPLAFGLLRPLAGLLGGRLDADAVEQA